MYGNENEYVGNININNNAKTMLLFSWTMSSTAAWSLLYTSKFDAVVAPLASLLEAPLYCNFPSVDRGN